MKTRESGMPDESVWDGYFSPCDVLARLGLSPDAGDVVDFGCGYGTFAIPAARVVAAHHGTVHALDIDPAMIEATLRKAEAAGVSNVRAVVRDFVDAGTGLADGSIGFAMLFNLLHAERPDILLAEARRVLRPGGTLALVHWRYDAATPRGPSMTIRPKPGEMLEWARAARFAPLVEGVLPIDLPPYHYGLSLIRDDGP